MRLRLAVLLGVLGAMAAPLPARGAEPPADPIQVRVSADPARATVGDPIVLRVEVSHPPDVTVSTPIPLATDDKAVAIEEIPRAADAPSSDLPNVRFFRFRVQVFETGRRELPAFAVEWRRGDGKSGRVTSGKVTLEVESVLKSEKDAPADLKPPAELPAPPFPWREAIGIGLGLLAIAAALIFWWRRRKPAPAIEAPPAPALPPHEQAFRELERLLASSLLREGRIKEFHVELIEILKRYLEGRFGIEALDRTTHELLIDLQGVRVGAEAREAAREILVAADLVKFARHLPPPEVIRGSVDRTYRLIDLTRVAPAVAVAAASLPEGATPEGAA